jgi:plasmid stability protein
MKMVQVRNVPDDVHRKLKERAAREGTTLSDLIRREMERMANRPSPEELAARIRQRTPVPGPPAADVIREERDRR